MKTPILLIIFNRPRLVKVMINELRKVKPTNLFIFADGPRENKSGEDIICLETRKAIEAIDWECNIKTNFLDKNLGCKLGPITAINWFFENVEEGIILEDDCKPSKSFFTFCSTLLEKYRTNETVMHISGNNFQNGILRGDKKSSYYFSKYTHSWGWATWKKHWLKFNNSINNFKDFDESNKIKEVKIGKEAQDFWIKNFRQTIKGTDSWDSLWMYTVWYYEGLSILPQINLVSNIGFEQDATHTKGNDDRLNLKSFDIEEILHPTLIIQDEEADIYTFNTIYKVSLFKRIYYKIKSII